MENSKAKNLIIIILIILLLACLGVVVWQYLKLNNTNNVISKDDTFANVDNVQSNEGIVNNKEKDNNISQENNQGKEPSTNKTEENKINPYANYKQLNWSTTSANAITSANIKILKNKVYVTYEGVTTEVTGIEGTPIKVAYTPGAMLWFEVLTKEGKVYSLSDWDTKAELYISKYNIIDMTTWNGEEPATSNYYLTADGKLINDNGEEQVITTKDPYANYKKVKWATISEESKTGSSITITKDKRVVITYEGNEKQVTGISGIPSKAICTIGGGIPFFYILTEEGKVYNIEEWDTEATLVANLSKYGVIDMTPHINGNDTYSPMCYLTSEGKLIDSEGKNYK